ncbi:NPFFR2 [Branchiostoma lanceolatum]|uniref:NPFFR2 protein n=1 Tax=Branchiostoma lanceolatum TaxID=7740 RepID=A0A8J9Z3M7_BRALA|nr:NPFFR2 [Branchiostoma lanceolatum]
MNSTLANSSDVFHMEIPMLKHPPAVIAIFVVGYVITFMATMIGNCIVCYVILKIPHMRNVTNYFVFNLAVSDMLSAIFCMPFTLVDHIIRGWPFGEAMCKVFPAMQIITVAASLFTLVAIAFDRFYAVVHPTTHTFTSTVAVRVIVLVWAMAIFLSIPIFVVQENKYQSYYDMEMHTSNAMTGEDIASPKPHMNALIITEVLTVRHLRDFNGNAAATQRSALMAVKQKILVNIVVVSEERTILQTTFPNGHDSL